MPFDKALDDTYKLGIKGAKEQRDDVFAERVDEQIYREGILERSYGLTEVADLSHRLEYRYFCSLWPDGLWSTKARSKGRKLT